MRETQNGNLSHTLFLRIVFPQISLLPFNIIHPFFQQIVTLYIHFLTSYSFFNASGVAPMPTTLWKVSSHHHPQLPCCQTQWSLFRPHPTWERVPASEISKASWLLYHHAFLSFSSSSFSNKLLNIGPKCFLYRVFLMFSPISMVLPAIQWKWKCSSPSRVVDSLWPQAL